MASLLPMYLRNYYGNEPLFNNAKIIFSVYDNDFKGELNEEMKKKVMFDGIDDDKVSHLTTPNYNNLIKLAVTYSDGVIVGSENISEELVKFIDETDKPKLDYHSIEEFTQAYQEYYLKDILNEEID
jgi:starch synthase